MNLKLDTYPEIGRVEQKSSRQFLGNNQGEQQGNPKCAAIAGQQIRFKHEADRKQAGKSEDCHAKKESPVKSPLVKDQLIHTLVHCC